MCAVVVHAGQDYAFRMELVAITVSAPKDMNRLAITVMQYNQVTQVLQEIYSYIINLLSIIGHSTNAFSTVVITVLALILILITVMAVIVLYRYVNPLISITVKRLTVLLQILSL